MAGQFRKLELSYLGAYDKDIEVRPEVLYCSNGWNYNIREDKKLTWRKGYKLVNAIDSPLGYNSLAHGTLLLTNASITVTTSADLRNHVAVGDSLSVNGGATWILISRLIDATTIEISTAWTGATTTYTAAQWIHSIKSTIKMHTYIKNASASATVLNSVQGYHVVTGGKGIFIKPIKTYSDNMLKGAHIFEWDSANLMIRYRRIENNTTTLMSNVFDTALGANPLYDKCIEIMPNGDIAIGYIDNADDI